jgi:drug/metabolite transporter (DMT)-like permease
MKATEFAELVVLAAIWGASFLMMRIAVPEFGPLALTALRVAGATLLLAPLVAWRGQLGALRNHWQAIAVVGLVNSALPFVLFSVAALAISAGLASIFNATAPLWGAVIAWLWLGERLNGSRIAGLALGFAGVAWLAWDSASVKSGAHGVSAALAIGACVLAAVCYGFGANYTKRRLAGAPPLAVAAGSQLAATALLAAPAWAGAPAALPSARAWTSLAVLALLCTGVAYLMYFRLIARLGARAIAVTYLIPLFAVLWGTLFLGEALTPSMVAGCAVVLAGTALATGMVRLPMSRPA